MNKKFLSRPLTRALGTLVVVVLTGCQAGIDAGAMPDLGAVNAVTAPAPAAPPAVATPVTTNYGIIETYKSASPGYNSAQGKVNGLTTTSGKTGAVEKGAADAPKKQSRLVKETKAVLASGGTAVISVTGNTDPQQQNTDNSKLSADRAKKAAQELARDLGLNPADVVRSPVQPCPAGNICITYKAGAINGTFAGRNAVALAEFNAPVDPNRLTDDIITEEVCCAPEDTVPQDDPRKDPVKTPTDTPNNPTSDNTGGTPSGSGETGVDSGDPEIGTFTPDNTSLRVTVSAPDPFRVGGTLREQTVKVVSVVLLCDGRPCAGASEPTLNRFVGELSIVSSSTRYTKCAYSTSSNCAFYIATTSTPEVRASGANVIGGIVRAGFVSPTPSGVYARPTLKVGEVKVRFPGSSTLSEVKVTVVWTTGETATDKSEFSVNRRVIGSIGS